MIDYNRCLGVTPDLGSRDWNQEFQEVMEFIPEDEDGRMYKFQRIFDLARNFRSTATFYGKLIISGVSKKLFVLTYRRSFFATFQENNPAFKRVR
jgi:hypothetical protein